MPTSPDLRPDELGPRAVLTETSLTIIAAEFELGSIGSRLDLGGTYNQNIHLRTSAGEYVVRAHRPWMTIDRLQSIQQTRCALAGAGLPVPGPLSARTGDTVLLLDGRLVEVERFFPHTGTADSWDRYEEAFRLLGRLHDALRIHAPTGLVPPRVSNYGTLGQLQRWLARTLVVLRHYRPSAEAIAALAVCEETRDLIGAFGERWEATHLSLPIQPIHGDYGGGNVLFRQECIAAILDFDFLAIRERVFELAYALYWLLARLEPNHVPEEYPWGKVAELLATYNGATDRPLLQPELSALPIEMARVPLYWVAEAGFTPDPVGAVMAMAHTIPGSRWLTDHASEITRELVCQSSL